MIDKIRKHFKVYAGDEEVVEEQEEGEEQKEQSKFAIYGVFVEHNGREAKDILAQLITNIFELKFDLVKSHLEEYTVQVIKEL